MGPIEEIIKELKEMNKKIDELPAAVGSGTPQLIEGKAVLTPKEASEYMNVGENALRDMARSNQIPHIMHGNRFLFPINALNEWMKEAANKNYEDIKDPSALRMIKNG